MQRIWITGESGTGKTTLARCLGKKYNIPVYHRDSISWGENDYVRSDEQQLEIIKKFTSDDSWIFEGNMFTLSRKDGRFDKCDTIIHLKVNRFLCVYRGFMRWLKHRNNPRPEFAKGCKENYPMSIALGLIFSKGKDSERDKLRSEAKEQGKNVIILKGRRKIKAFYKEHGLL
jgi:adenylate kinase family enzyme